jgi:tRNA (cytidine32/uridine32-2'-O)-methyltransferase
MPVTDTESMQWDEPLVTHEQMEQFYPHIEKMLAEIEFLDPKILDYCLYACVVFLDVYN